MLYYSKIIIVSIIIISCICIISFRTKKRLYISPAFGVEINVYSLNLIQLDIFMCLGYLLSTFSRPTSYRGCFCFQKMEKKMTYSNPILGFCVFLGQIHWYLTSKWSKNCWVIWLRLCSKERHKLFPWKTFYSVGNEDWMKICQKRPTDIT